MDIFSAKRTLIMGVLNVTPDSFSDGGQFVDVEKAMAHAKQMISEGADIIDVGGESSRPGAESVSEEEELSRVVPVIEQLKKLDCLVSLDTCKANVARAGLEAGAHIINDITGLSDSKMIDVVRDFSCPVILMHMQGEPRTMQEKPTYGDVVEDICAFFEEKITLAHTAGVKKLVLDPGIGFGKTVIHNLEIINRFEEFTRFGLPLLIGCSRKSVIGNVTGTKVSERLSGTLALHTLAQYKGASILRVHDVKEAKQAAMMVDATRGKGFYRSKSLIEGMGIFSLFAIHEGDTFYEIPLVKTLALAKDKCAHLAGRWIDDPYVLNGINHSCDPNTLIVDGDKPALKALKDIAPGEEITVDYSLTEIDGEKTSCSCGTSLCRGFFLKK